MPSALEQKVRELDNKFLAEAENRKFPSLREATRRITPLFDGKIKQSTMCNWLSAKRRGYSSYNQYQKELHIKQGTTLSESIKKSREKKYKKAKWYKEILSNLKGFESDAEYQKAVAQSYGFETANQLIAFKRGRTLPIPQEKIITYLPNEELETLPDEKQFSPHEEAGSQELRYLVATLGKREQKILKARFYKEKTLERIGNSLGLTKQRIGQIESETLSKLRSEIQSLIL